MSSKQNSPGIQIREIDLTNFVPTLGTSGGAFVGEFVWGPVNEAVIINDSNTLGRLFGKPNDFNYVDWFSASNFLAYSNNLQLVRVVNAASALNSTVSGTGIRVNNKQEYQNLVAAGQGTSEVFVSRYPGILGDSIKVSIADSTTFATWRYRDEFDYITPGTSDFASRLGARNDELHIVVIDEKGKFTGIPGSILEKYAFLSKATDNKGLDNEPNFYGNVINNQSNYIWYFGPIKGVANLDIENSIDEITVTNGGSGYGKPIITFTDDPALGSPEGTGAIAEAVLDPAGVITAINVINPGTGYTDVTITIVDSGEGATAQATQVAGVVTAIEPISYGSNYYSANVSIVDGGEGAVVTATIDVGSGEVTGFVVTSGGFGYAANAAVVLTGGGFTTPASGTVVLGPGGSIASVTLVDGGSDYTTAPTVAITPQGSGATATAILGEVNTAEEGLIVGYTIVNGGTNYGNPQVIVTPGGSGATADAVLAVDDVAGTNWGMPNADELGNPRSFYGLKPVSEGAYSKVLFGGSDGDPATASDLIAGWEIFKNAEEIDVGLLFVGRAGGSTISKTVIRHVIDNIAEYRRDCMVFFSPNLVDVLNRDQVDATRRVRDFAISPVNGVGRNTSFAVCDSGWKLQYDVINDKYRWIPLNADVAGLCAQTETNFDAWWSPAGLNRGAIKNIVSLAFNPNRASRDELYKANINSVVSFTGEGTFLYGDRTQLKKNSAFSYINVRRLFIVLQKSIGKAARNHLFEFNDDFTRSQFRGIVEPFLRMVKSRRGIYDYHVICDESNNTPDIIDSAQFVASVFVKPARSINFITLNFVAVRTGVEFSEVVGAV